LKERYIPQVQEAVIPEDGGWAELIEDRSPVLILSVPEWKEEVDRSAADFSYAWLYDRANDAYLFCFRLEQGREYAIAFAREHAGMLLADERAHQPFSLLITAHSLEADDLRPCLLFRHVSLKRHPQAGW
jgi:hypothetical protein